MMNSRVLQVQCSFLKLACHFYTKHCSKQACIYDVQYEHQAGFSASLDTTSLSCLMAPSGAAMKRCHGLIRFIMPCDIRNVHMGSAILKMTMVVPNYYDNLQ